jgi:hypothetical protein
MPRADTGTRYVFHWHCCDCGQKKLGTNETFCPACEHPKCANCILTRIKLKR